MITLRLCLENADAKVLMNELWFLRELRQQEGKKKESAVLDIAYQVLNEQVAEVPDSGAWDDIMKELNKKP